MRIMGLDYGSVTVGVAISDELLFTAQGIEVIRRKQENKLRQTYQRIETLIEEYGVEQIVVGYPKHLDNSIGERAKKSEEFAEDLNSVMKNLNEISTSVNQMTKDEKLKTKVVQSIDNLNTTMCEASTALETLNGKGNDKENLKQIVNDTSETVTNLKKFSEKLNKRFLLFRLMF